MSEPFQAAIEQAAGGLVFEGVEDDVPRAGQDEESMKRFPDTIPHFADDRHVEGFFRYALGVEFIDDIHRHRESARQSTAYARHLKEALEYLIRERPATTKEWAYLTEVSFWEEDRLYGYLQDLYDYFYGSRREPPEAPDPEETPPESYWQ